MRGTSLGHILVPTPKKVILGKGSLKRNIGRNMEQNHSLQLQANHKTAGAEHTGMVKMLKYGLFLRSQFTRAGKPVTNTILLSYYVISWTFTWRENYDLSKRSWHLLQIVDGDDKLSSITKQGLP